MPAPTPSLSTFLARYPEFETASVEYEASLLAILAEAAAFTSDWAFPGVEQQMAYCLMHAAQLAYQAPFAREMRLDMSKMPKDRELRALLYERAQIATMGIRVF